MKEAAVITSTHLAKNLSDVLNRVHYQGSSYVVERNGVPLATLGPARPVGPIDIEVWLRNVRVGELPGEGFGDDLAKVVDEQPLEEFPEWPSS